MAEKAKRDQKKCQLYAARNRRFNNKLKRVRKSCGENAAVLYNKGPKHSLHYIRRHGE